jgi:outer membrane lipoprotein carrier protein
MGRNSWFAFIIIGCMGCWVWGGFFSPLPSAFAQATDLEAIISGIEQRYAGRGFSAAFFQESMLKAMQISDTAEGKLTVKRPGKMRWEYTLPDEQVIITNGSAMWIYRPADRQVMVGRAPDFFGQGKGAGFLSDIRQIRDSFNITLAEAQSDGYHRLLLRPLKPTPELAEIILSVAKTTYQVDQVITHNAYGDETRIVLEKYQFNLDPDESLFNFNIPEGIDVIQLDPS